MENVSTLNSSKRMSIFPQNLRTIFLKVKSIERILFLPLDCKKSNKSYFKKINKSILARKRLWIINNSFK